MNAVAHQQLISDLSRDVVGQLSPQELPLFRITSQAYFQNPEAIQVSGKDQMIGFGAGEVSAMIIPVALAVTTEVVASVAKEVKGVLKEEGGSLATDWLRLMFKKYRPGNEGASKEASSKDAAPEAMEGQSTSPANQEKNLPPPLTPQQLAQVREIALNKARQLRLSETNAKLLADTIVGGLAVSQAG